MVLTSWLKVQNLALARLGLPQMTTGSETTKEATLAVGILWDVALEEVLQAHEWPVALKDVYLGNDNTLLSPTLPVGKTETSDAMTVYGFALPTYDASGSPAAGTIPFEILKIVALYPEDQEWAREGGNIITGVEAITDVDHYITVIKKISYSEAGADLLLVRALGLKLAQLITRSLNGKDENSEAVLRGEYGMVIREAIARDNHFAQGNQPRRAYWHEGVESSSEEYSWESD